MIRNANTFVLCVTSVSATGYETISYGANPPCGKFGTSPGGDPGDPGDPTVPFDLSVEKVQKGRNYRAKVNWQGGAAQVDIFRSQGADLLGVDNNGSYTDNLGKTPSGSYEYTVCNTGFDECVGPGSISFP
jgi:hypothetical protein